MRIILIRTLFDAIRKKKTLFVTIFNEKSRGKKSTSGHQHDINLYLYLLQLSTQIEIHF